jgi:hypothetical protein
MTAPRVRLPWLICASLVVAVYVAGASAAIRAQAPSQEALPALSDAQIEEWLQKADVIKTKGTAKGVTGSIRATLSDGKITHDAHIQSIDESKREFQSARGTEFNFRDSFTFNIAGYKIDRLIGLNMVPVSVSRRYRSKPSAFTWWIDDVIMDEGDRLKKKIQPPDPVLWNQQSQLVHLFDQLIYNVDRNMGNLIITKDWRLWAIDHTRAFRTHNELKSITAVTRCDRQVFEAMKRLNEETLQKEVGKVLDQWQIRALLARRDAIVARLESLGPAALYDRKPITTN